MRIIDNKIKKTNMTNNPLDKENTSTPKKGDTKTLSTGRQISYDGSKWVMNDVYVSDTTNVKKKVSSEDVGNGAENVISKFGAGVGSIVPYSSSKLKSADSKLKSDSEPLVGLTFDKAVKAGYTPEFKEDIDLTQFNITKEGARVPKKYPGQPDFGKKEKEEEPTNWLDKAVKQRKSDEIAINQRISSSSIDELTGEGVYQEVPTWEAKGIMKNKLGFMSFLTDQGEKYFEAPSSNTYDEYASFKSVGDKDEYLPLARGIDFWHEIKNQSIESIPVEIRKMGKLAIKMYKEGLAKDGFSLNVDKNFKILGTRGRNELPQEMSKVLSDYETQLKKNSPDTYKEIIAISNFSGKIFDLDDVYSYDQARNVWYVNEEFKPVKHLIQTSPEDAKARNGKVGIGNASEDEQINYIQKALEHQHKLIDADFNARTKNGKENPKYEDGTTALSRYKDSKQELIRISNQIIGNSKYSERIKEVERQQNKALEEQKMADETYEQYYKENPVMASIYYNFTRPLGKTISSIPRKLFSIPSIVGINLPEFESKVQEGVEFEKYVSGIDPTELQKSIFERPLNIIPNAVQMIADVYLMGKTARGLEGMGMAARPAMFTSTVLTTYSDYEQSTYKTLKAAGVPERQAKEASHWNGIFGSMLTGLGESFFPGMERMLAGGIKKEAADEIAKYLIKGATVKDALTRGAKSYFSELPKDLAEEVFNVFTDAFTNAKTNYDLGGDYLDADINGEEIAETMIMTLIPGAIAELRNFKTPNGLQKAALFEAMSNPSKFSTDITNALNKGIITDQEAKKMVADVEELKSVVKGMPDLNISTNAGIDAALLLYKKKQIKEADKKAYVDDKFAKEKEKASADKIADIDNEIDNIIKYDSENRKEPIPGEVGKGEELKQAEPIKGGGVETISPSGDVQAYETEVGSVVEGDIPALKDETPILSTPKILSTDGLPNLEIVESKEASQALESEIGGDKGVIDENIRTIPIQEYDVTSNKRSKQIAEQIEENGWIEPLIVSYDKNGNVYIVEGQHRAAALKELGYDKAPVIVIHEKDLGKQSLKETSQATDNVINKSNINEKVSDQKGQQEGLLKTEATSPSIEGAMPVAGTPVKVDNAPDGNHLNIGMLVGKTNELLTQEEILAKLPADVTVESVTVVQGTEPTLSIKTSRPLTDVEMEKLLDDTQQEAIPQVSDGVGVLHDKTKTWGDFNPEYFVDQTGKPLAVSKTEETVEERPANEEESRKWEEDITKRLDEEEKRAEQEQAKEEKQQQPAKGEKKITEENKAKLKVQGEKITKALKAIDPKVEVIIYETQEEFEEAAYKATREAGQDEETAQQNKTNKGFFDPNTGKIHINGAKFITGENTLLHEGVHPILNAIEAINPQIIEDLHKQLKQIESDLGIKGRYTEDFAGEYDQEVRKMEALTEFIADVANGDIPLEDKTTFEKVKDFFRKMLKAVGINMPVNIKTPNDLVQLAKDIKAAFDEGRTIKGLETDYEDSDAANEFLKPGSVIDGTSKIQNSVIKKSLIKDFDTTPTSTREDLVYPEKENIESVLEKSGGAAIFINSDATKVGKVIVNGREIVVDGGIDYTFIKKNVEDNIGFAASDDGKISVLKNTAQQIMDERDRLYPEHKGKPIAVFVTVQSGQSMLGEWYASEYIMEGIETALNNKKYKGGLRAAKSDFRNAVKNINTGKSKTGIADGKAKLKVLNMIDNGLFDTHEGRLRIAREMSSNNFSFGFRVNLNNTLISINEKSANSGKNRSIKEALVSSGHSLMDFWSKFMDERFFNYIKGVKQDSKKDNAVGNKTISGFYYNPNISLDNQVKHAKLGIQHAQFNSSFMSEGNFLLDSAHDVNQLFPEMAFPTENGINEYNKANNTNLSKKDIKLVDKLNITKWLLDNKDESELYKNKRQLIVKPFGSISMSMYTGVVSQKYKVQSRKSLVEDTKKNKFMTEDGEGNYVFYHYATQDLSKKGINPLAPRSNATGKDEQPLAPASYYYTEPDIKESMVRGQFTHIVKVPKDKVYPFDEDPLNLLPAAEKAFKKAYPNVGFDANKMVAWVSKEAEKRGYPITVSNWAGVSGVKNALRAQSPVAQKPIVISKPVPNTLNQTVSDPNFEYKSNRRKRGVQSRKSSPKDGKMQLPIYVTGGAMKAMKAATSKSKNLADITQAGIDYVKTTDWYLEMGPRDQMDVIDIIEHKFGNIYKTGVKGDEVITAQTIDEALKKGIKVGERKEKAAQKDLTEQIKDVLRKPSIITKLSLPQYKALVNEARNVKDEKQLEEYKAKVGEILEKQSEKNIAEAKKSKANNNKTKIKKAAKNEKAFANDRPVLKEFARINPAYLDDIDEYNEIAEQLLNKQDRTISNEEVLDYVEKKQKEIEEKLKQKLLSANDDLLKDGTITENMTLQEMRDALEGYKISIGEAKTPEEKLALRAERVKEKREALEADIDRKLKELNKYLNGNKPSDAQQLADVQNGDVVTFIYNDESDVPETFKDKISSVSEINGVKKVRVTVAKSLADYELQEKINLSTRKQEVIDALNNIDRTNIKDETLQLINRVIDNIMVNDSYARAGDIIIAYKTQEAIRETKFRLEELGFDSFEEFMNDEAGPGSKLVKLVQQKAYNTSQILEAIEKYNELKGLIRNITDMQGIFSGHADMVEQVAEFSKAFGKIINKNNSSFKSQVRQALYSFVSQDYGGTDQDIQDEFNTNKERLFESIKNTLVEVIEKSHKKVRGKKNSSFTLKNKDELISRVRAVKVEDGPAALYDILNDVPGKITPSDLTNLEVYAEIIDPAQNARDVRHQLNEDERDLVDFMRKEFSKIKEALFETSEIWDNEVPEFVQNYLPLVYEKLSNVSKVTTSQSIDEQIKSNSFAGGTMNKAASGTTINRDGKNKLGKDKKISTNFHYDMSRKFREALYQIHTLPARRTFGKIINDEGFRDVLGGNNADMINNVVVENVKTQLNITTADPLYTMIARTIGRVGMAGSRMALGTILFGRVNQALPPMIGASIKMLGKGGGSIFTAPRKPNKNLFKHSNIKEAIQTGAGFKTDYTVRDKKNLDSTFFLKRWARTGFAAADTASDWLTNATLSEVGAGDAIGRTRAWMMYYKHYQKTRNNVKNFKWKNEYKNPNKAASAYADQQIESTQSSNTFSALSPVLTKKRNFGDMVKATYLGFQTFAITTRARLLNDTELLLEGTLKGDPKLVGQALQDMTAIIAEFTVFATLKVAQGAFITMVTVPILKMLLGLGDDEAEELVKQLSFKEAVERVVGTVARDFLVSGIPMVDNAASQGINWLYKQMSGTDKNILYYKAQEEKEWYEGLGTYSPFFGSWANLGTTAYKMKYGVPKLKKGGVIKKDGGAEIGTRILNERERDIYTVLLVHDALRVLGIGDQSVNTVANKLRRIAEKEHAIGVFKGLYDPNKKDEPNNGGLKVGGL